MAAIEDLITAINAQNAAVDRAMKLLKEFEDFTQTVERDPVRLRSGIDAVVEQAMLLVTLSNKIKERAEALRARTHL